MSNTKKKKLKHLTLKDNFMFGAVMMEEENCKDFLELALGISVDHVEVSSTNIDSSSFLPGVHIRLSR